MEPFFLRGETKARRRLLQEVLFSHGWNWVHSQQRIMEYPDNYIYVESNQKHLYNWDITDAPKNTKIVPSEEFLADPWSYLISDKRVVVTNK